jgi:PTH1 family peptidyl-tRNA hydrolase
VVRVKRGGGSGGHRGLRSCFAELGTQDFIRIRVGIGRPPPGEDPVEYVLNRFDTEQQRELPETITLAADAAREIIRAGVTAAMNRFNRRLTDGGER